MKKDYKIEDSKFCNERVIQKTVETLYEDEDIDVDEDTVRDIIEISQLDLLKNKIKEGFLETVKFPYLFKFKANTKQLNIINQNKINKDEKLGTLRKRDN
jgi:hypothetical protein